MATVMFIKLTQIASCHLVKEHVPPAFVWWVENWLLYTQGKGIPGKEAHYSRLIGGNFRKEGNLLKASWAAKRWVDLLTHLTHTSDSLWPRGLYSPWNSPGQNTGMGSFPSPRDLPIQELNPGLLYCRWILYQLSHKGSPRILECIAYPFFSGSSWPRNWTRVSCRWILYQLSYQGSPPHPPTRILKFM